MQSSIMSEKIINWKFHRKFWTTFERSILFPIVLSFFSNSAEIKFVHVLKEMKRDKEEWRSMRVRVCVYVQAWVCVHVCSWVCVVCVAVGAHARTHSLASLKCTKLNCEQGFFSAAVRKVRVILKLCKKLMCVLRSQKFAKALIYLTIYKLGLGLKRLG